MGILCRLLVCIFIGGVFLYKYIDKLNELTELRLSIPLLSKEVRDIQEKNLELQFAIESFESPPHLMELANKPELGHLKFPYVTDVIFLPEAKLISGQDNALETP